MNESGLLKGLDYYEAEMGRMVAEMDRLEKIALDVGRKFSPSIPFHEDNLMNEAARYI